MRRWHVRTVLAGLALLGVAGLGACDNGTDPGNGGEMTGSVLVTVTADGSAESGVAVDLFAESGTTVLESGTTDASGEVTFSGLASGTYEVEITVPDGLSVEGGSARETVNVSDGQQATVSFSLVTPVEATDTVEVALTNYEFTPADLTIAPNTMVRWVNESSTFHTITPDGHSEWTEGSVSDVGDTFTHVFTEAGTFPYYCDPHRSLGMTGSVTVESQ